MGPETQLEATDGLPDASAAKISRQAERSERTRSALLEAAEMVFAREGFEAARIEDIAAEAGRSRGAFYANFESKTELFLELRTRLIRRRAQEIRALVEPLAGEPARHAAVERYLLKQICDGRSALLQMEFKLFAIRHPDLREQLAVRHLEAATRINREELAEFFPSKTDEERVMRQMTLGMEAVLEGFAVNLLFSPEGMEQGYLERVLPGVLQVLMGEPA